MQRIQIFNSNRVVNKSQYTIIGTLLFFVLLFPLLGHTQFKSYANSNFSGALTVNEPPNVTYPASKKLSVN